MAEPTAPVHRLCAVLLADVAGFSRAMGENEARALAGFVRVRGVFEDVVPRHGGKLEVAVGDCFVALFDSAANAVAAAIEIQRGVTAGHVGTTDDGRIRIGLHLGDVVRRGNELFGDSVNTAARLQTLAKPGGITLSGDIYRAARGRVNAAFKDLGRKRLKNIAEPVRVYEIDPHDVSSAGDEEKRPSGFTGLAVGGLAMVTLVASLAAVFAVSRDSGPHQAASPAHENIAPAPLATPPPTPADKPRVVGVTSIIARGDVPEWMRDVTRDGLNTVLSKVRGLRVFSREKIDFVRERRGLKEIEAAETLGIEKMIAGAVEMNGDRLVLEARVVDTGTGILEAAERVEGTANELIELQNRLAASLIDGMKIALNPDERRLLFAKRTNDTLDSYRKLADTFADAGADSGTPSGGEPPPTIPDTGDTSWWPSWSGVAHAADGGSDPATDAAIRAVLEAYRAALEQKNLDALAAVHVELNDAQRAALGKYFESAEGLRVAVADVEVMVEGGEALVTFTRRDAFTDRRSGKPVELEVRLSSIAVQVQGAWKLRGVKKS